MDKRVLKLMNKGYTVEQATVLVDAGLITPAAIRNADDEAIDALELDPSEIKAKVS